MALFNPEFVWPIAGAVLAGGVIGAEREYRGSPAGFRTHILVSLSAALLMLAAVHQVRWLTDTPDEIIRIDPVRMAHGILTGIGFLCGGVIFRQGLDVRGLTTAASLWTTSALGILFGVGFYGLALAGAAATLVVLAAVAVSETLLPHGRHADIAVRFRRDAETDLERFRELLASHGLRPQAVSQRVEDQVLEFSATVLRYDEERVQPFAAALRADPAVVGFDCLPHKG
jgi:putative Mg2+ transporter-C (MgtC) family protein